MPAGGRLSVCLSVCPTGGEEVAYLRVEQGGIRCESLTQRRDTERRVSVRVRDEEQKNEGDGGDANRGPWEQGGRGTGGGWRGEGGKCLWYVGK